LLIAVLTLGFPFVSLLYMCFLWRRHSVSSGGDTALTARALGRIFLGDIKY
jgi:hypothetical protein